MRKTQEQNALIRDSGGMPFFWQIVSENDRFLHIRNWLNGENRVLHK